MNLLSLFQSPARDQREQAEANRIHRYEYGIKEVQRWIEIKKAIIEDNEDTTRRFQETIAEHARKWGTEGEGMKILRWNMESFQQQAEEDLQEADYRLAIYRNIVLMQGRIWLALMFK